MLLSSARGLPQEAGGLCTPAIRISLSLPEAPDFMDTADLAQPKCSATSLISSALARPSTGGDWIRAVHVPVLSRTSSLTRARGLTRTSITSDACAAPDRFAMGAVTRLPGVTEQSAEDFDRGKPTIAHGNVNH